VDNYGPIYIPKKGVTVNLNMQNISLYKRLIDVYENNDLKISGNQIYINGQASNQLHFQNGLLLDDG